MHTKEVNDMTSVTPGTSVTLLAQFYAYEDGPAVDLDTTPTITITNISNGTVVLAATTTGVTHPSTGAYGYTWTPPANLPLGDYLATWTGLASGTAVTAAETVTAVPATAGRTSQQVWYCTREDVARALDSAETARNNGQIDRVIESASRAIEGQLHRKFYPQVATRTFDWPDQRSAPWRLWLDQHELISITTLTAGGVDIPAGDYLLRPDDGPPHTRVEIDLSSSSAFAAGSTHQRAISITGVFGHSADEAPAGALAEALDADETTIDVTDSAAIGVGQILRVDSERMIVTGKTMQTTGQTLQTPLDAQAKTVTVPVVTGSSFAVDEVILLDAERMLIVDIAGNNLVVKRAWDGSVLAAHTASTIYALRTLTVQRGALGTTASTHTTTTAITKHMPPGLISELCIAEALNGLGQRQSGYARQIGSGENAREAYARGLKDIRAEAYAAYGRKARIRAV